MLPLKQDQYALMTDHRQAHLVLGFRAPSFGSKEYGAFRVLNTILNGMGGKLFVELREKKSMAYSVFGAYDAGKIAGIYQVYIGCAASKTAEVERELLKVLDYFSSQPVSQDNVKRAQTYLIGLYLLGLQSNRSQVQTYTRYELAGPGARWVETFAEQVKKVTASQIQTVARKYFGSPHKTGRPEEKGGLNVHSGEFVIGDHGRAGLASLGTSDRHYRQGGFVLGECRYL